MKTFKQYNESIRDYLKPKSKEEMEASLKTLDIVNKVKMIKQHNLSDKYMPSNDEIEHYLRRFNKNHRIEKIIKFQLPYELLPRDSNGICFYDNLDLDVINCELTELPDNLEVSWTLYCNHNELTKLPKGLKIGRSLYCYFNKISELPDDLKVKDAIYCDNNRITKLLDNINLKYNLRCDYNLLTELPKGLKLGGYLKCDNNIKILELPKDAQIGGQFIN